MSKLKRYDCILSISSHEVNTIIDVLARARLHQSRGRLAISAELIQQAENRLRELGKEGLRAIALMKSDNAPSRTRRT